MKHILIDSLYINSGGGYSLLDYLVTQLCNSAIPFFLIKDVRCPTLTDEERIEEVITMTPSIIARKTYYTRHKNAFSSVLCFGNLPAPIKMSCPVYTYFQNVNLLSIPKTYSIVTRFKIWLKRNYIAHLARYTDSWIIQTSNTEQLVKKYLPTKGKCMYKIPFYNIPSSIVQDSECQRTDYILVGNYYFGTKGHDTLLNAWELLAEKGFTKCLHLTISNDNVEVCRRIDKMKDRGINVVNHGTIPFSKINSLYYKCKAIIYPSINESLGLGIVEAIHAGCDVVATDLPYVHSICIPSALFEPNNPKNLADAVLLYDKGTCKKSSLIITNKINELINLLTS